MKLQIVNRQSKLVRSLPAACPPSVCRVRVAGPYGGIANPLYATRYTLYALFIFVLLAAFCAQTTFAEGSIIGWGSQVVGGDLSRGFVKVAAGGAHSLGLKQDGSIVAWGANSSGQCNVPSPNSGFIAISAGWAHSLGLRQDGSIVAWGSNYDLNGNYSGQCNLPSPNTGFIAISAGGFHSLGLKQNGSIVAWGANNSGQCNLPSPNTGFIAIAAGGAHSLGLKQDGSIVAWGGNWDGQCNIPSPNSGFIAISAGWAHSLGLKQDGSIVAWGRNDYEQCNIPSPNSGFIAVAAGYNHSLGLKSDGSIVAWGRNNAGQCNIPSPNTGFIAIAAGGSWEGGHSLGLKQDGSIVAWGRNDSGQCNIPSPNTGFVAVAAGSVHNLGLKVDSSIVAWGYNNEGQCNIPSPNSGFIAISAGGLSGHGGHSLGLKRDGSIVAWGANGYWETFCEGELCWDEYAYSGQCNIPSPNTGFIAIAAGGYHSLGLKQDGSIVAWGRNYDWNGNYSGQCNIPSPNSGFIAIAAGGAHSLGLKQDGSIVAWGNNDTGTCDIPSPNSGFIGISAGMFHSLGLKQDGSIVAWGRNYDWNGNYSGQCNIPSPNTGFIAISAGGAHSLGLKQDGSIVAWGANSSGQRNPPSPNAGFVAVAAGYTHNLALTGAPGAATGSFTGVLYDYATGKPITGATISIAGGLSVQTDQNGKFTFASLPVGEVMVTAAKAGYTFTTTTTSINQSSTSSRSFSTIQRAPLSPFGPSQIEGTLFNASSHCYFLNGVPCSETVTVTLDWGSHTPSQVRWILPNGQTPTDAVSGNIISRKFDMGNSGLGRLSVVAIDASSIESSRKYANFEVIPPPPGIPASVLSRAPTGNLLTYTSTPYVVNFFEVGLGGIPDDIPVFGGKNFSYNLIGPISPKVNSMGDGIATAQIASKWEPISVAGIEAETEVSGSLYWVYTDGGWHPGGLISFSADAELTYTYQFMIGYVPVFGTVDHTFNGRGLFELTDWDLDGNPTLSLVKTPIPPGPLLWCWPSDWPLWMPNIIAGVELASGAGFADILGAEWYLGGTALMWMQFPEEPHLDKLCIIVDYGVRVVALTYEYVFYSNSYDWCFDGGDRSRAAMSPLSLTPADISKFRIMGCNYFGSNYAIWAPALPQQERMATLEGEEQIPPEPNEEQLLQFNVFGYSQPSISADGNNLLLAWVYDDPNRDPGDPNSVNRMEVVFSRRTDGNWTEPRPIDDDGTSDFSPMIVALADGNALCVWENANQHLPNDTNLTEMAAAIDIKAAHYDSVSGTWSAQNLTSNNHLDRTPRIAAADNGTAVAVWIYNEKDDILGLDPNALSEIRYTFWNGSTWTEPNTIASGIGLILKTALAYDGNEAVYVYSLDTDCNWATDTDQELYAMTYNGSSWSQPYRITDDNSLDANPQVIYDQNDIFLVWYRDANIVSCRNLDVNNVQQILSTVGSSAAMDFRLAKSPAGQMSLFWADTSAEGVDIFTVTYDPALSIWSKSYQLTTDRYMERSLSATYAGAGELAIAYNKVEIIYHNGLAEVIEHNSIPEPNRVDLYVLRHTIRGDLAIDSGDISLSVPNPTPGSTVNINAVIHNAGDVAEVNVPVAFYNGDPNANGVLIGSQTIPGPIPAGDTTAASVSWLVPEVNEPQQIYVVIDPNLEIQDAHRNNNVASIQVMAADLTVAHIISERIGPKIRAITARIANTGSLPAENIAVTIHRDSATGPEIANLNINKLEPNSFYDVWHLWTIAAEDFNDIEIELYVTVDEPNSIRESNENNNTSFSLVKVGKIADVTDNGKIDFADLANLAQYWQSSCSEPDWCQGCDFDQSGYVDFADLAKLVDSWLWQPGWYTD